MGEIWLAFWSMCMAKRNGDQGMGIVKVCCHRMRVRRKLYGNEAIIVGAKVLTAVF